jgi:hypothetical protein
MKLIILILSLLAMLAMAETKFYKCMDNDGDPIFSQNPCDGAAEIHTVTNDAPANASTHSDAEAWGRVRADSRKREIEREILRREGNVVDIENDLTRGLNKLTRKASYANNNHAGATYRESIATEKQALTDRYNAKIDREQKKVDRLEDELSDL